MENAARGRFPFTKASLLPEFHQNKMISLIQDSLKLREQQEKKPITHNKRQTKINVT
jgi:hypothetical protein